MHHYSEKKSTDAVTAIEYRNVCKRFESTEGKPSRGRRVHVRRNSPSNSPSYSPSNPDSSKQGDGFFAVNDLSATVRDGELITILGSSGCGKTTLLKMTNRLY